MKVTITKDGRSVEAEIPDEQFEKLFADKKTGYERVNRGSHYYGINAMINAQCFTEDTGSYEKNLYDSGNYFSDKTVAENMARAQRLWNKIHRRAIELCEPIQTTQMIQYYVISYDMTLNKVVVGGWTTFRGFGAVYFDTEAHCKQVIDEFHDELLWYFTEFKDRADM